VSGRVYGVRVLAALVLLSSLAGVVMSRNARPPQAEPVPALHVLIRGDSSGSVFDPQSTFRNGVLKVIDPLAAVEEIFHDNAHLYTLNVHQSTVGVEVASVADLVGHAFAMVPFQIQLVRSMVPLLMTDGEGLTSVSAQVGIDRYLGAFAGLLLRTCVAPPSESDSGASVRARTEAIIFERATDPRLTPGLIAEELSISLRQLYRAFDDAESPAALIRRRRLERAAELLASRRTLANVEAVAAECGFASAEYFSRAFRREFGLSPRAYRSMHRDAPVSS
jgi:AraC-like DNA-binding protein